MKKIVIACTVVLASAAMLFVSCAPSSCKCSVKYADDEEVSYTYTKQQMDIIAAYTPIKNCHDLQVYLNDGEYEGATVNCR